jgi:hypothetical protein
MAEKVAHTGVKRDNKNYLYFIKDGAVWQVARKQPGVPKGKREKIAEANFGMDPAYLYFLDGDGDISRSKRAVGGQKRKKKVKKVKKVKKAKKPAPKKAKKPAAKKAKKPAAKKAKKPAAKKAKKPAKKAKRR